ncbi:unnamed protein product [Symbiodinium natans]|uniref:Uncharacterized protein n=1 Tax=Symbiodinium natans TaxID=878477 RepID=A0A812LFB5_9DINO|nr:unnamed protein product [Symbiodinium natans]
MPSAVAESEVRSCAVRGTLATAIVMIAGVQLRSFCTGSVGQRFKGVLRLAKKDRDWLAPGIAGSTAAGTAGRLSRLRCHATNEPLDIVDLYGSLGGKMSRERICCPDMKCRVRRSSALLLAFRAYVC